MGVCGRQPSTPSELFNKQLVSRPDALPSLLPALSPRAPSRIRQSMLLVAPASPWCRPGPGWGGRCGSGWGSWAALGSCRERSKLEHLSCSPTDVLSPFSTWSRANRFPSALSVCRSYPGDNPNPPQPLRTLRASPEPGGCNCFKLICKFTPLPPCLTSLRAVFLMAGFSLGLFLTFSSLWEPELATGWGRSRSSPWFLLSPPPSHRASFDPVVPQSSLP